MGKERRKISYMDQLFYYQFSEEESCSIVFHFELKTAINKKTLKKAVNMALLRYPNFRQKPMLDKKGFLYTVENDKEADVYPYDPDPIEYGTEEVNGYMFRVMHMGKKLWISAFHSLCDGRGMYMFARTLLYYYFSLGGCRIRNESGLILTDQVPADPTEMADPLQLYPEVNSPGGRLLYRKKLEVFRLPGDVKPVDKCGVYRRFQFILKKDKFLALAHEAETSFDAYFNLSIARMIRENYNTKGALITELGCVDMRPFYQSRTLQNLTWLFMVPFIEPLFNIPEKYSAMMVRNVLMYAQLQKQNFDVDLHEIKTGRQQLYNIPLTDAEGLKALRRSIWEDSPFDATFFTTDVGPLDLGEDLDAFVKHADIYVSSHGPYPSFVVMSQGNEVTVNLVQRFFDKKFALRLVGFFRDLGVLDKYIDCGRFICDKFHVRSIEREK